MARHGGDTRTYRVGRIRDVERLAPFPRPAGFDLAAYWAASGSGWHARAPGITATVRLAPVVMDHLALVFDAAGCRDVRSTAGPRDERDWRTADIRFESVEHGARLLLQCAGDAEVLGPAQMRDRVVDLIGEACRRYPV